MAICFICKGIYSLEALSGHFNNYHRYDNCQEFKCVEESCSQRFDNFFLFKKHHLMYHKISQNTKKSSIDNSSDSKRTEVPFVNSRESIIKLLLDITIQLHGSSDLTRQQVQYFFELVKKVVKSGLDMIKNVLEPLHSGNDSVLSVMNDMKRLFALFIDCFEIFNTEHKRMNLIGETGAYFPPIEYLIGKKCIPTKKQINESTADCTTNATGFLFPLRDMLKRILQIPGFFNEVHMYLKKLEDESVTTNFVQSKLWKFLATPSSQTVLPLFLYFDDFETGNPLGAHAGINKMGAVYFSLPFLPPEYRYSLVSIINGLLFHSKDREQFGNFAVFRPLIEELKYLESQGIVLNLPQGKVQIYFKLGLILGDNLGLHSLLGFTESFRANFACRFCKMNKNQRAMATIEDKFFIRTQTSYEKDLSINDMSLTGIKDECIFHKLQDFHVVNNMSVDIMHDLFEHVCSLDMAALIKHYIKQGFFTLATFNNRLRDHDYGPIDSDNIPPKIDKDRLQNDKIKMSASEMWTFVRHFGLIVGDLVPEDDPTWRLYLNLREILALVSSTKIQKGCTSLLRTLVAEHHKLARTELNRDLKPTDHHLVHYSTIMDASGPLVNLWCMRFESKHREQKMTAISSSNKINLCKTIALKQQLKLTHQIYSGSLFSKAIQTGLFRKCTLYHLSLVFDTSLQENHQSLNTSINIHNWVEKNGSRYKNGLALCIGLNEGSPQFGIIQTIYSLNDAIFFIYKKLTTVFIAHIDGFKVIAIDSTCSIISYENLDNVRPIGLINKNEDMFIIVPSYL